MSSTATEPTARSTVENISATRVKVQVEVPFAELKPNLDSAYRRIAGQITVPGFRRGKVPSRIIDQRVGRAAVLEEAINEALPQVYARAVTDHDLRPLGRPTVDVTDLADGDHVTFTAEVDVVPVYTLPEYRGIAVEVDPVSVSDEDIDNQLTGLRERFATVSPVEREAAEGDVVIMDITAERGGEEIPAASGKALSYIVGSGALPGLDEVVSGATAGFSGSFTTRLPDDAEGADDILCQVSVSAVRERVLPELDDDFAGLASEFDTLTELRADVAERLTRMKRLEQGSQARDRSLLALLNLAEVEIAESAIESEVEAHFANNPHGEDGHRAEVEDEIRRNLKSQIVLDDIADAEELTVNEQELTDHVVRQAQRCGMAPDELARRVTENNQIGQMAAEVRRGKALALVMESAAVVDSAGASVDLGLLQVDGSLGDPYALDEDEESDNESDAAADIESDTESNTAADTEIDESGEPEQTRA